ncbi:esterase/lipase family protein [Metabacillus sp. RGM 3146]|uniref:esterase/lipase family protein n=1 Tax=Metabacillus sp. RGM 3146 TaxID=3401092 RepID=UPI003B9AC24D
MRSIEQGKTLSYRPGGWYLGEKPTDLDPEKPPIVFVHGFHNSSFEWWKENDMYDLAFENGYQTAFAELFPAESNWVNGKLLSKQLRAISKYFGQKVMVVAHSKGGVDTQTAAVYYGAYKYIANLITLSPPFYGSQLADLAYSGWTDWLSEFIDTRNGAIYSLQTGNMANFRKQTDQSTNTLKNQILTLAGNEWGTFGTSTFWGGIFLSQFGDNDGAVTVKSTRLPYSNEIKTGPWDHFTIKQGSSTFHLFEPYLSENKKIGRKTSIETYENQSEAAHYFKGGKFEGVTEHILHVENGVRKLHTDWLSSSKQIEIKLISPSGISYDPSSVARDHQFFKDAFHHFFVIDLPEQGEWRVEAKSEKESAFLLNVHFDSDLNRKINPERFYSERLFVLASERAGENIKMKAHISHYHKGKLKKTIQLEYGKLDVSQEYPLKKKGYYIISIDLFGTTEQGEAFQRSILHTAYVDQKAIKKR